MEGMDLLLVLLDRLRKYAHFIPFFYPYTTTMVTNERGDTTSQGFTFYHLRLG